jgi:hypothetical protein
MRPFVLTSFVLLAACNPTGFVRPPPSGVFYYPTGLALSGDPASRVLYVAGSNFDKRYDSGMLTAVRLADLGLPAFNEGVTSPRVLTDLKLGDRSERYIDSFAGPIAQFPVNGKLRLFVPTRSEGDRLVILDATGTSLDCVGVNDDEGDDQRCFGVSPSLSEFQNQKLEDFPNGKPSAPAPVGIGISLEGDVYVAHQEASVSPPRTSANAEAFLVELKAGDPVVQTSSYVSIADVADGSFEGTSSSVAVGERYVFVNGRGASFAETVRLIDRTTHAVGFPRVQTSYNILESRGLALSSSGSRLYVLGRFPDTLLEVAIDGPTTSAPRLTVVRAVPLPEGPTDLMVVPRTGRGDLVFISSPNANRIAIYDQDLGKIANEVIGLGEQPFGMTYERIGNGLRLYTTAFGSSQVYVTDFPDVGVPGMARVVAKIGTPLDCTLRRTTEGCP